MDQPTINIILKNIQGSPFTSTNDSVDTAQTVDEDKPTSGLSADDMSAPTTSDDAPMSDEPQEVNESEANATDGETQTTDKTDEDTKAPIS